MWIPSLALFVHCVAEATAFFDTQYSLPRPYIHIFPLRTEWTRQFRLFTRSFNMERTIIVIGSIPAVVVFLMLAFIAVPGSKKRAQKLASCPFRRSQDPVLPMTGRVQGQPSATEASEQQKGFIQRQVEALRNTGLIPADITVPPETHQPTRTTDLIRQNFKQKYLVRSPGKDARQDEMHRRAREGYKPAPFIHYY